MRSTLLAALATAALLTGGCSDKDANDKAKAATGDTGTHAGPGNTAGNASSAMPNGSGAPNPNTTNHNNSGAPGGTAGGDPTGGTGTR